MKVLIALFCLALLVKAKSISADQVVVALDCGSDQAYKSVDGIVYEGDSLYTQNSKVADYTYNQSIMKKTIKYTEDQQLYKTERHADDFFAYSLPIPSDGTYTVVLKFCELYFTEPGKRVFNVKFGDTVVAQNVDIVKEVGPFAAYDLYIEVEFKSKQFFVKGAECPNALDPKHNGLIIDFVKIGRDLPKVDGILVLKGGIEQSNQSEYQNLVKKWNQEQDLASEEEQYQKIENIRKQIKDEFDSSIDLDAYNKSRIEGIADILLSWKGVIIFAALILFQLCLIFAETSPEENEEKKSSVGNQKKEEKASQKKKK